MLLFWRKGYEATSMNDLCDAMGVRSPSLYAAFGSKEALYLEAVEHYVQTFGPPVWDRLAEGTTARAGVEKFLIAGTERLPKSRTVPAGCMAALAAISDEWPASIARVVKKVRLDMLGTFARAAGRRGGRRRVAGLDGYRWPEPILSRRFPGHGGSGAGRRHPGGVESRRRSGDGGVAG